MFICDFINDRYELFKNNWFKILNDYQLKKCDEIYNNFNETQKQISCNNLTFIHGDIKSPNIFYDIENGYEPYFIDWQHCAIGKGCQDLIFFIIESFDIEREYYDAVPNGKPTYCAFENGLKVGEIDHRNYFKIINMK